MYSILVRYLLDNPCFYSVPAGYLIRRENLKPVLVIKIVGVFGVHPHTTKIGSQAGEDKTGGSARIENQIENIMQPEESNGREKEEDIGGVMIRTKICQRREMGGH